MSQKNQTSPSHQHRPADIRKDVACAVLLALMAFAFVYVFCISTSPMYDHLQFDQNIFNIMGYDWATGGVPYVTTWDCKGPLVFFMNMLGFRLAGGIGGVFIVEAVHLAATLLVAFFLLRRFFKPLGACCCVVLYTMAYACVCSQGNQAGEYEMLLSVAATVLACRWSRQWNDGDAAHPWQYALVYGLFFGSCFLSRATNAVAMAAWTAVVFVVLVGNRLWRNLLLNIGAFAVGFAIIFVPFAAYFCYKGAFADMMYGTIGFNIEYFLSSNSSETWANINRQAVYFTIDFLCILSLLAYSAVTVLTDRKNRKFAAVWLFTSLLSLAYVIKSYGNANYAITFLPLLFVVFIDARRRQTRLPARMAALATVLVIGMGFANYLRIYRTQIPHLSDSDELKVSLRMTARIPREDSFIAYNCLPYIYLADDRLPCYKYFAGQDWYTMNAASIKGDIRHSFGQLTAQWVLVKDMETSCISDILRANYRVVLSDKRLNIKLLRLRKP